MFNPSFTSIPLRNGAIFKTQGPGGMIKVHGIVGHNSMVCRDATFFVFVQKGKVIIDDIPVGKGMYACVTDSFLVSTENTKAVVIEDPSVRGMFMIGGPIEDSGRLKYIDGCTDSLLVPPVKLGYPCLNLLHFPEGINQTMHTHPSVRIGMVVKGYGECVTPFGNEPLIPGNVFVIHREAGTKARGADGEHYLVGSHCFRTTHETMSIVAFHPDSDVGPTDEDHPMLNKTIVNGLSAKHIDEIRTK